MSNYRQIEPKSTRLETFEPRTFKRPDWRRAFRAINVMRLDPARTDQVFELNVALDGGDSERQFQRFLAERGGADLMQEGPDLLERLSDFAHLETLEPDTLGSAYLRLMRQNGFDPDGLRKAALEIDEDAELYAGPARRWFSERSNCVHDLLHVVTGYGQDQAGETALLAFTDGMLGRRTRMRVTRFGMIASTLTSPPRSLLRTIAFGWRARRRGVRSRIPFSFRWEDALDRPLAEVRNDLGVRSAQVAHPGGMLRGTMDGPWSVQPQKVS